MLCFLGEVFLAKTHKLFFETKSRQVRVIKADCLSVMPTLRSESVDMIFADPPYFGNQSGLIMKRTDGHALSFDTGKAHWAKSKPLSYQFEFHRKWLEEAQRVLKRGSTLWVSGTYHSIGVINVVMQDLGFKILNEIILLKRNAPPNFKGSCFRAVTENLIWAKRDTGGKLKFNYWEMKAINGGKQMSNVWEYSAVKNPFRHLATKNPRMVELCIRAGTDAKDLILDPFAGSGTTGVVAQALGRNALLIELESKSCALIKKRLEGYYGQYRSEAQVN